VHPEPFTVRAADEDLADLAERLARTRWPAVPPGWQRGTDPALLRRLLARWAHGYDWRDRERRINRAPQFLVDVDGVRVHFAHLRGRGPRPLPLVLSHGWPSSFLEFLPLAALLADPGGHGADPADAFDVVVPSLPGFGFSAGPPGAGVVRDAPRLWTRLMTDVLGHARFGAHGTDIGAFVTNRMALEHPGPLVGVHVTQLAEPPPTSSPDPQERAWLRRRVRDHETDQAYAHLHRTTPTTLGYGLHDSPVALAAWIVEKWWSWSDRGRRPESPFTDDQLLDTVMLYWLTGTAVSSAHAYADLALATAAVPDRDELYPDAPVGADGRALPAGRRVAVPTGVLRTAAYDPPRAWAERAYADLRCWSRAPRGGHFLALEEPDLLAAELRAFFRPLR
jgi:pimeloyl-ACP methyl ester carboxylesterase